MGTGVLDKSDPYCYVEVLGRNPTTFSTHKIWNDLNPVWDFTKTIDWDGEGQIIFKVYDRDIFTHDDVLAHGALSALQIARGFSGQLKLETPNSAMPTTPTAEIGCCCFSGLFSLGATKGARLELRITPLSD